MNVNNYRQSKQSGYVELKKYGQSFQCLKRQFSQDTGEEIAPQAATFTRKEIENQRSVCADTLADLDALLADIDALK